MAPDDIVSRLYALPLSEFTRERDSAARGLRAEGRRAEADEVKALRKPTAAAGAVNRLVREHAADVKAFLKAAAVLRDAQVARKGDLRSATERERQLLAQLVSKGGEGVRRSLQAAAVDEGAARQLVLGRLETELESRGFGTLLDQASLIARKPSKATAAATKPKKPKKPDDRAARARLLQAKETVAAAEVEERQAHERWKEAEADLEQANAAAEKAQATLDRLHAL